MRGHMRVVTPAWDAENRFRWAVGRSHYEPIARFTSREDAEEYLAFIQGKAPDEPVISHALGAEVVVDDAVERRPPVRRNTARRRVSVPVVGEAVVYRPQPLCWCGNTEDVHDLVEHVFEEESDGRRD